MRQPMETGSSHGSIGSYATGFLFSVLLTLGAYMAVTHPLLPRELILVTILLFGGLQLVVQLVYFLHLDRESSPRWNLTVFAFSCIIVTILMGGSIWIMNHLNHQLMPEQSIVKDEGIKR